MEMYDEYKIEYLFSIIDRVAPFIRKLKGLDYGSKDYNLAVEAIEQYDKFIETNWEPPDTGEI